MKEKILLTYQDDCINAIKKAFDYEQKYMTVELPQSVGKRKILAWHK